MANQLLLCIGPRKLPNLAK